MAYCLGGIKSRNSTCYHGCPKQIASVTLLLLLNGCEIPQEQIRRGTECILSNGDQEQGLVMTYGEGGSSLRCFPQPGRGVGRRER